ncbi:hypothetical protein RS130_18305 [Paraglaciecola aquimarina]|uniref:Phytase-like domain-containing protein n=1 Tax=Paraglaciecola aquimarina TaxID=1235557 RepID=A0ABU3T002_9ALTE|nr:hypothetical protein [Paraglaciecola aquimarina]MDU0355590.1 hypothetical protein [Paraglaciecola aquimarina]
MNQPQMCEEVPLLYRLLLIVLLFNSLTACSSVAQNTVNFSILSELPLPAELRETSALYCPEDGSAYTVNDSGNKPIIYQLDDSGNLQSSLPINIKNKDWESLTGDKKHFYIGDVGNNNGKRKFVQIHTVDKQDLGQVKNTIRLHYLDNSIKGNEYLNHDFDSESIVSMGQQLYLFSKSWRTNNLYIYRLEKDVLEQKIRPFQSIEGLPDIVTGGDYDAKNKRFILLGYELKGLGRFYPFVAILNQDFKLVKSFLLDRFKQVEGLCVTPKGDVWITQEGAFSPLRNWSK